MENALVTPLPKPGDPTNPSNYRPISSLPILSKIAEKIMSSQIRQYLESNSLISLYCDLESAAAGTVGQRAAWPHKNY